MNQKERALYISKKLAQLYPNPEPPLVHKDAYTFLIAVLLSARCTDLKVNQITPKLFALADNPWAMARLDAENIVRPIIRPCGLSHTKAKAIVELSKILISKYEGGVPSDFEALEALPGVGHKTASVVRVQYFGKPAFPVDTHVYRLARRWRLSQAKSILKVEKDLKQLFPEETWGALHLRMIYYGRAYCSARACNGMECPICQAIAQKK